MDGSLRQKILLLCQCPSKVTLTGSAKNDSGRVGVTKEGILRCIEKHIQSDGVIEKILQKKTGKPAYLMFMQVLANKYYVKVQFYGPDNNMIVLSFHPAKW